MKAILVCLSFFVAYCCATGLAITDLAANTNNPVTGLLSGPRDSTILYYRVFLPRNASSVAISITQTDNVCEDLVLQGRTGQAPCPDAEDETNSICQESSWYETFTGTEIITLGVEPRTSDEDNRWESNQWIYFGVSKEYSFDDDNNCTFTINSITTTYCAAGTTIVYSGADTQICTAYSPFSFGTPIVITSSSADALYYSTNLPGNSYGRVSFWINSTSPYLFLYAKTGAAPTDYSGGITYDCYNDDSNDVGEFYIYSFDCITPIGGNWYYFGLFTDDEETYNATIIPTLTTCNPSGLGGYNCSAPNTKWSPNSPTAGPFTIPTNPSYSYGEHSFNYFYYDVNASLPQNPFTFVFTTSSGDGETYMRHNAFPEYSAPYGYSFSGQETGIDSEGDPTVTWHVYPSDLVNSARIYWAIETDSGFAMTYSLNGTLSTTGAPTTAAPTTGNTGNTTSDSTVLVASFFLVVVALIATLF